MRDQSIIPPDSPIGRRFRALVRDKDLLFMAGLPSSGKSLLLQQLMILAHQAYRSVHVLQWDRARAPFETGHWLSRFPEVNNLTHPAIRKAVGIWAREAVAGWQREKGRSRDVLIAELPVVGGRLAELLCPADDGAEAVLRSDSAMFLVPVPTTKMRRVITGFRAESFARPRNDQETRDAPLHIVAGDWLAARRLYNRWNGLGDDDRRDAEYDPDIYRRVFGHLLRYRNLEFLSVDREYPAAGSAYDRPCAVAELTAAPDDVARAFTEMTRRYPGDSVISAVDRWHDY